MKIKLVRESLNEESIYPGYYSSTTGTRKEKEEKLEAPNKPKDVISNYTYSTYVNQILDKFENWVFENFNEEDINDEIDTLGWRNIIKKGYDNNQKKDFILNTLIYEYKKWNNWFTKLNDIIGDHKIQYNPSEYKLILNLYKSGAPVSVVAKRFNKFQWNDIDSYIDEIKHSIDVKHSVYKLLNEDPYFSKIKSYFAEELNPSEAASKLISIYNDLYKKTNTITNPRGYKLYKVLEFISNNEPVTSTEIRKLAYEMSNKDNFDPIKNRGYWSDNLNDKSKKHGYLSIIDPDYKNLVYYLTNISEDPRKRKWELNSKGHEKLAQLKQKFN